MHEGPHFREGDLARLGDRPDAPSPLASRCPELARRNVNVPRHAQVQTWQEDEARIVVITELGDLSDNIVAGAWLPLEVAEARTVRRERESAILRCAQRGGRRLVVGNLGEMLTTASGWNGSTLAAVGYVGCGGAQQSIPTAL
jgi:hypothetical protein